MKNWNLEIGKMPEFDGEYLCYIHHKQECGNIIHFQRVLTCSMNNWIMINKDCKIIAWKELDKDPTKQNDIIEELINTLSGLVLDVGSLLCDVADLDFEWQQAGYYNTAKELLLKIKTQ